MAETLSHRYDFVFYFDVENGNPNGDPDAGNMPRIDAETGIGLVSDVCLKRKVRNYVALVKNNESPYRIYVQEGAVLNDAHENAYIETENDPSLTGLKGDDLKKAKARIAQKFMLANYYDVRTFGAVMSTGDKNCGQVRGPVQFCFSESEEPIIPAEMSITRMAVTNAKDAAKEKTMGRKQYVPYGLYRMEGFVSAPLAEKAGFTDEDLRLLEEALMNMFESDRSAARGLMTSRMLVVFEHESRLGNASSRDLFNRVIARRTTEGPARSFDDYEIIVNEAGLPEGITADIILEMRPQQS